MSSQKETGEQSGDEFLKQWHGLVTEWRALHRNWMNEFASSVRDKRRINDEEFQAFLAKDQYYKAEIRKLNTNEELRKKLDDQADAVLEEISKHAPETLDEIRAELQRQSQRTDTLDAVIDHELILLRQEVLDLNEERGFVARDNYSLNQQLKDERKKNTGLGEKLTTLQGSRNIVSIISGLSSGLIAGVLGFFYMTAEPVIVEKPVPSKPKIVYRDVPVVVSSDPKKAMEEIKKQQAHKEVREELSRRFKLVLDTKLDHDSPVGINVITTYGNMVGYFKSMFESGDEAYEPMQELFFDKGVKLIERVNQSAKFDLGRMRKGIGKLPKQLDRQAVNGLRKILERALPTRGRASMLMDLKKKDSLMVQLKSLGYSGGQTSYDALQKVDEAFQKQCVTVYQSFGSKLFSYTQGVKPKDTVLVLADQMISEVRMRSAKHPCVPKRVPGDVSQFKMYVKE